MDAELLSQLYEAAEEPHKWEHTLKSIAKKCGAVAAIITLRSSKNAQVVISEEMKHELHTPYIAELSRETVAEYVNNLIEKDVWAHSQAIIHPHVPTLMSRQLPMKELQKSELWPWLKAQGINDTVVLEIGHSKNYWTALNIFFWNEHDGQDEAILDTANTYVSEIRRAWGLSRNTMQLTALKQQLISHVQSSNEITLLLDEQNAVVAQSRSVLQMLEKGFVQIDQGNGRLSLADGLIDPKHPVPNISTYPKEAKNGEQYFIHGENSQRFSTQTGETIGLRTLIISPTEFNCLPWEDPRLDEREKFAVRILISSGQVKAIAAEFGITERHARTIWAKIREKLGNPSKHDLIVKYRSEL